jgi:hypothetical protein
LADEVAPALPPELAALASAAPGSDEHRRALEVALGIVALVDGGASDAIVGGIVAAAVGYATWLVSARWLVAAILACFAFPLAARVLRRMRLRRLRRAFARDAQAAWKLVATAWQRASPGQRAALMRITKPSA